MLFLDNLTNTERAAIRKQIAESSPWFIAAGVLLAVLGMIAIAMPLVSTLAAVVWVGWTLLFGGTLVLLHALFAWRWPDSIWSLLIGVFYIAGGCLVLYAPLASVLSLTVVVAAVFLAEGVVEILQAFRLRPLDGWGWLLFSGIAGLLAGALVAYQFPASATWALGLIFGANLLSTGLSFVFLALASRSAEDPGAVREFGEPGLRRP